MGQRVAILGASDSTERYAYRALRALQKHGCAVIPVNPRLREIEGVPCVPDLAAVAGPVDTLTMYVGPAISDRLTDQIVALSPGRVIFNPGSENPRLAAQLERAGIPHEDACTLVLLATNQF